MQTLFTSSEANKYQDMAVYQTITLYPSNICYLICQVYLNKSEKKKKQG